MVLMMMKVQVAEWERNRNPIVFRNLKFSVNRCKGHLKCPCHEIPLTTSKPAWLGRVSASILTREEWDCSLERSVQLRNTGTVPIRKTTELREPHLWPCCLWYPRQSSFQHPTDPRKDAGVEWSATSWIQSALPIVWKLIKCFWNKAWYLSTLSSRNCRNGISCF